MAREQALREERVRVEQQQRQPGTNSLETGEERIMAAAVAQRARSGFYGLTPRAAQQLQRVIGNRALRRFLTGTVQRRPDETETASLRASGAGEAALQMKQRVIGYLSRVGVQSQATATPDAGLSVKRSSPPGIVQRAPIDFKRIGRFLERRREQRYNILETQTVSHLRRLTGILEDRKEQERSPSEVTAIEEILEDIAEIIEHKQGEEVKKLGRSANWANAVLYVDGKAIANVKAQRSGLAPGKKKTRWGSVGQGKSKAEILISHNDSEATVFNMLGPQIDREKLKSASEVIELFFVSTNGACEGCKGRINEFVNQEILSHARDGVAVKMRYKYSTPPRATQRGIPTYYGWQGDVAVGDGFFEHTTVYRQAAG